MKMNTLIFWLIIIIILSLILRFASFLFVAGIRYWYITIPIILYIAFRSSSKKVDKAKKDKIEDAEFEVIDEEDETK